MARHAIEESPAIGSPAAPSRASRQTLDITPTPERPARTGFECPILQSLLHAALLREEIGHEVVQERTQPGSRKIRFLNG